MSDRSVTYELRRRVLSVAALTVLFAAACGNQTQTGTRPVIIGVAAGLSGLEAPPNVSSLHALELTVDSINSKGGVLGGRQLKVITADDGSDPNKGGIAALQVIQQGAEIIVVSCDFNWGQAAAVVGQNHGLLTLTLCAQSVQFGFQGIGHLAFNASPSTFSEGQIMATFADKKGLQRASILNDPTIAYDTEVCQGFKSRFTALGHQVVQTQTFQQTDSSIATQIAALKASNADFVFLCSYNPGGAGAIKQIRAAGYNKPILSDGAFDGDTWLTGIPNLSNFYASTPASVFGDDPDPAINAWAAAYTAKYGNRPEKGSAVIGSCNAEMIAQALAEAGSANGNAMAAQMSQWKDQKFICGLTTYTATLHTPLNRPMRVLEFQNGVAKTLGSFDPGPVQLPAGYS